MSVGRAACGEVLETALEPRSASSASHRDGGRGDGWPLLPVLRLRCVEEDRAGAQLAAGIARAAETARAADALSARAFELVAAERGWGALATAAELSCRARYRAALARERERAEDAAGATRLHVRELMRRRGSAAAGRRLLEGLHERWISERRRASEAAEEREGDDRARPAATGISSPRHPAR